MTFRAQPEAGQKPIAHGGRGRQAWRRATFVGVLACTLNDIFVLPVWTTHGESPATPLIVLAVLMLFGVGPLTVAAIVLLVVLGLKQDWKRRARYVATGIALLLSLPLGFFVLELLRVVGFQQQP